MRPHRRSRSPARSLRHQASRAILPPGRPSACRRPHLSPRQPTVGSLSLITFGSGATARAQRRRRAGPKRRRLATVPRVELQQRIADRRGEFLLFAVTPPKLTTGPEQTRQIAEVTLARLRSVGIDGLVLYDIDDESDRNPNERPFPFLPTMDPAEYLARDLVGLDVPAIVYRAVSKHAEDGLRLWLRDQDPARVLSVFVGGLIPREGGCNLALAGIRAPDRSPAGPAGRRS